MNILKNGLDQPNPTDVPQDFLLRTLAYYFIMISVTENLSNKFIICREMVKKAGLDKSYRILRFIRIILKKYQANMKLIQEACFVK